MRNYLILATSALLVLNILVVPTISKAISINNTITGTFATIPNNTIYLGSNSNIEDTDNSQLAELIEGIPNVSNVTRHNLYEPELKYINGTINDNHQFQYEASITVQSLDQASDLTYPIIAGRNVENDNEVVISSSIVDEFGLSEDDTIDFVYDELKIVGVYQDPMPYQSYQTTSSYNPVTNTIANQAYTIDSDIKERNLSFNYNDIMPGEEFENIMQTKQVIEVVFKDSNTQANLDILKDTIDDNVYVSNLGLDDSERPLSSYQYITTRGQTMIILLSLIDLLFTLIIYGLFKRGVK